MKRSPDRLYELLPAVYRLRDADRGYPLQALLRVINEQVSLVEADITQVYENWFIETCEDWVVPYIADLVGHEILPGTGEPGRLSTPAERARGRILVPRREVANILRYRRRKGALAPLELLARDAAALPARAVEFYKLLGWTQAVNFPHLSRARTIDLRDGDALDMLDGPFNRSAHSVDIRRTVAVRSPGRYNIPGVGLFVWRLRTYSITDAPAYCLAKESSLSFTFNILGNNTQLYNDPQPETEPSHIADQSNLPVPVSRRMFEGQVVTDGEYKHTEAAEDYYGDKKSISISVFDKSGKAEKIARKWIVPADLSDWNAYRPKENYVAVDPRLGRIIFSPERKPKHGVTVSYQYAFSADIGGGEYDRTLSQPRGAVVYPVQKGKTIKDALAEWEEAKKNPDQDPDFKPPRAAVIEIRDSRSYTEKFNIELKAGEYLQIRAANGKRPVIRLLDYDPDLPDYFHIAGAEGSRFTLDGLLITGLAMQISDPDSEETPTSAPGPGSLCDVTIRHCTLVPGRGLHGNCEPRSPNDPSLRLENTRARINIEHSIVGSIEVESSERAAEPQLINISDSILDATGEQFVALSSDENGAAYVDLTITRSTVIGITKTHSIALAENSIFAGQVTVARRQQGCVRFCYVPPGSRTPRRYECQPDMAIRALPARLSGEIGKDPAKEQVEAETPIEQTRVRPRFDSLRYGTAVYCRLSRACAREITRGADDESEMGVFHDLYLPQRVANLQARLDDFTPSGADAAIIYAD